MSDTEAALARLCAWVEREGGRSAVVTICSGAAGFRVHLCVAAPAGTLSFTQSQSSGCDTLAEAIDEAMRGGGA